MVGASPRAAAADSRAGIRRAIARGHMRPAVIGTGYVGLVAGAGFSDFGNDVVCVDLDADRVRRLSQGEIPIHEPGLAELVRHNLDARRLSFTTDTAAAVKGAEV